MVCLPDNDDDYLRWIAQHHLGGYVANYGQRQAGYPKLPRANCRWIGGTGNRPANGRRWIGDWRKACGTLNELESWAREKRHGALIPCGTSNP